MHTLQVIDYLKSLRGVLTKRSFELHLLTNSCKAYKAPLCTSFVRKMWRRCITCGLQRTCYFTFLQGFTDYRFVPALYAKPRSLQTYGLQRLTKRSFVRFAPCKALLPHAKRSFEKGLQGMLCFAYKAGTKRSFVSFVRRNAPCKAELCMECAGGAKQSIPCKAPLCMAHPLALHTKLVQSGAL